jgi:hypothetical protein
VAADAPSGRGVGAGSNRRIRKIASDNALVAAIVFSTSERARQLSSPTPLCTHAEQPDADDDQQDARTFFSPIPG